MSLKISDLAALNTITVGATGFTPKLLVEGSNSSGLAEIYVSAGSGNTLRLNTNFSNGNYIDINPYITGVSNGGFEIVQSGTQRFVITAGGNIGIGATTDAGYKLDVNGSGRFNSKLDALDTITYGIYGPDKSNINAINNKTDGTAGFISLVGYSGNPSNPYRWGGISGGKTTAVGDGQYGGYLSFWTTSGGENGQVASASYERMRIASNGNVAIGTTTTANGNLTVKGGATSFELATDSSKTQLLSFDRTASSYKDFQFRANDFIFSPLDVEKMRITSGGRLLLGDTVVPSSPWRGTAVFGINNSSKVIIGNLNSSIVGATIGGHNSALNAWDDLNIVGGNIVFSVDENPKVRFKTNGNVLINSNSDNGYKLQVDGGIYTTTNSILAGTFTFINLENNSSKLQVGRFLAIQDNASNVGIGYNQDSVPFGDKFSVNGSSYFNGILKNTANATFGLGANRPVTYDSNGGNFRIKANAGGWATGYFFDGSSGTYRGGFGAYGDANSLIYYWVGDDFNAPTMVIQPGRAYVGINTSTPARRLDIIGGHTTSTFRLRYDGAESSGVDASVDMWASEPGISYAGSGIGSNINGSPYYGRTNPALGQGFIRFIDGTTAFHNSSTNAVNAERMRIMPGGNILIGTTTDAGYKLDINGNGRFSGDLSLFNTAPHVCLKPSGWAENTYIKVGVNLAQTGVGDYFAFLNSTGKGFAFQRGATTDLVLAPSGAATFSSSVTATGFFNSSDIRLKEIVPYEYSVSDIKPISYLWKDSRDNKKHVGYSAQDVQKVMPDAVNEGEDGMLSVNYIEVLVAKIAELENRIKQLEK